VVVSAVSQVRTAVSSSCRPRLPPPFELCVPKYEWQAELHHGHSLQGAPRLRGSARLPPSRRLTLTLTPTLTPTLTLPSLGANLA
jgi:hypothetical protein